MIEFEYVAVVIRKKVWLKTSAYKIQTPGNYPEELPRRKASEHGESLKS